MSQMPNHPANSFYYPRLKELPPIASIKITQQSRSSDRQTPMSNHILPNSISPQRFSGKTTGSKAFWPRKAKNEWCYYTDLYYMKVIIWSHFQDFCPSAPLKQLYITYRCYKRMLIETALVPAEICTLLSFFTHTFLTPLSPSIQRHHWTAKCLSGHPGVCVWAPVPEGASATARVTSSCGRPTLASPALSWRNRLNAYHTAVWDSSNPRRAHKHRYCQYSTLGLMLSLLDWEMLLHLEHFLDNTKDLCVCHSQIVGI